MDSIIKKDSVFALERVEFGVEHYRYDLVFSLQIEKRGVFFHCVPVGSYDY